jgi:hypothetical protein
VEVCFSLLEPGAGEGDAERTGRVLKVSCECAEESR